MSTLGQRTALLRRTLGLTQKEFAKVGEFSQSNLSLLENDGVVPNLGFIIRIMEAFPTINANWWIAGRGNILLTESAKDIDNITSIAEMRDVIKEMRNNMDEMRKLTIMSKTKRH